jgi:plasmid stabilization system protein ParE
VNVRFHPGALLEYEDAVSYYERRQVDLGKRFILMVEAALDSIREAPMRWPILEQDVRRHLIKVFPYAVLYTSEGDHILVLAIMHCHGEPGYWRARLAT